MAAMRVGFILLDKKRPRVLTSALIEASAQHGVELVALDPANPQQWAELGVHVIVHKVPEDTELDNRLQVFCMSHPNLVVLDPPNAVRALQHREAMLSPLAGEPLLLKQHASFRTSPDSRAGVHKQQQQQQQQPCMESQEQTNASLFTQQSHQLQQQHVHQQQHACQTCLIAAPAQITLHQGCSCEAALQQLASAGMQLPALVKPLTTAPNDAPSVAAAASHIDGHALGVVFNAAGVQQLLQGAVPELSLPVVLQQFVPHGQALYKLYVIGPHVVLTRRSTLTQQHLDTARAVAGERAGDAAGDAGRPGVVLLQRVSAVPLPSLLNPSSLPNSVRQAVAPATDTQAGVNESSIHQAAQAAGVNLTEYKAAISQTVGDESTTWSTQQQQQLGQHSGLSGLSRLADEPWICNGVALADASVAEDAVAPPLWAMQQLAAYLRQKLQLNLFNIDIIAPEAPATAMQQAAAVVPVANSGVHHAAGHKTMQQEALEVRQTGSDASGSISPRRYMVVDVNFFPGYDKVPGAEQLFADYLASLKR